MNTIAARSGAAYIDGLQDNRSVFIDGGRVENITSHPAFANSVRSYGRLYDYQADPKNLAKMTFACPTNGRPVGRAWQIPENREELVARRAALEAWSELSFGLLGRSPDHVATSLGGMIAGLDTIADFPGLRSEALRRYFADMRDRDAFVSYVINDPQGDKTKSASEKAGGDLVVSVVGEDDDGIVVRGAKMLGTSAIMADELFVGSVAPLQPGEERYSTTFAIPVGTEGLKMLSRKSYEAGAKNSFDYPLSRNFDENDALVWFENVKVPWERVFTYRDVVAAHGLWHRTPAHSYHNYQSQIRFSVKLRFLAALAKRVSEVNGAIDIPTVRGALARLARQANIVAAMVMAAEAEGSMVNGHFMPSPRMVYSALSFAQEIYPLFVTDVRQICGGGVIMLPSSVEDFNDPELNALINATQVSSVGSAEDRVKTFRLAWDAIGSEFASRHTQYEMFYGGASRVVDMNVYRTFDWASSSHLVDNALGLMGQAPRSGQRN